jgi:hypothetical protein
MADLADVEESIISVITGVLYPGGTSLSVVGADCRVYRGWPVSSALNADLASNVVNVTVFPSSHPGRVRSPLPITYRVVEPSSPFTVSVSGSTASFAGTPSTNHCTGIMVDGSTYVYRPRAGDSAASVAAELATFIGNDRVAHLSGTSISVPGARRFVARAVADRVSMREVRRQERDAVIALWCPAPGLRDLVASQIDTALAAISFLPLADSTSARIRYVDTLTYDQSQSANLYRRDLVYSLEYPTVVRYVEPEMLFGQLELGNVQNVV